MVGLEDLHGLPLYIKIREAIRNDIINGNLRKGEKLSSEDDLSRKYNVSRMTLRQGVNELVDEGLLYKKKGIGTFVSRITINRDHTKLNNFLEDCKGKGINANEKILNFKVAKAKRQIAKGLNISEKDLVFVISTVVIVQQEPMSYHDIYVSFNLFPNLSNIIKVGNNLDLWSYFESNGYSIRQGIERIEAQLAHGSVSQALRVTDGSPVLYKERTLISEEGTSLAFQYCYNRGDLYSLTISLHR